jgi:DNA adenine methylase
LIIAYRQIKEDVQSVISLLQGYQNNADFYYETRSLDVDTLSLPERAARMIFLNKSCSNEAAN